MTEAAPADRPTARVVSRIVIILALYQGAVPLVTRPLFGADQRFAPALWLPSPWWWLACLAIVAVAAAIVLLLDAHRPIATSVTPLMGDRPTGDQPTGDPTDADPTDGDPMEVDPTDDDSTAAYDVASALVFLVGIYNGVLPLVSRLLFDSDLRLAFTLRLRAPWWWIASIAVLVGAAGLLIVIDQAKERRSTIPS